ncbi:hypothetical protein Chor_008161, partial [Crotalus horridus]
LFSLGFLSSHTGTGADFDCPSGWSAYDQYCYRVIKRLKMWDDAESEEEEEEGEEEEEKKEGEEEEGEEEGGEQCSTKWSDGSSVNYENLLKSYSKKCFGLKKETDESLHLWYLHVLLQKSQEPLKRSSGTLRESLQEVIKFSSFYPEFLQWYNTDCEEKNLFVCKFPPEC